MHAMFIENIIMFIPFGILNPLLFRKFRNARVLYSPISVIDAFAGNIIAGKRALSAKSVRWQGFVTDSRKIVAGTTWGQVLETRDKSSVKRV